MKPFTATEERISFLLFLTCNNLKRANKNPILKKKVLGWKKESITFKIQFKKEIKYKFF